MPLCESCRTAYRRNDAPACETCERHHCYGVLIEAGAELIKFGLRTRGLALLDAVADVMAARDLLIREHRKELNDEIREGQRAAHGAYLDGRTERPQ